MDVFNGIYEWKKVVRVRSTKVKIQEILNVSCFVSQIVVLDFEYTSLKWRC